MWGRWKAQKTKNKTEQKIKNLKTTERKAQHFVNHQQTINKGSQTSKDTKAKKTVKN